MGGAHEAYPHATGDTWPPAEAVIKARGPVCLGDLASRACGRSQTAIDTDAHPCRCGVKIVVRRGGIFSELLSRHSSRQKAEAVTRLQAVRVI